MSGKFTIRAAGGPVVVRAGGAILAESAAALVVEENGHDPVHYFPKPDVGTEFLSESETRTTCPLKGEATHWNIEAKSGTIRDAAWSYEDPKAEADRIRGYLAFYPDKALVEEI